MSDRQNNFDFVRYFAAFLVVWGHSVTLLGGHMHFQLWGMTPESAGVSFFLSLSGYLVTESWLRDPRLGAFIARRMLRLFPALIACVLITACLLGPMVTTLRLREYFVDPYFADYFRNLLLLPRFHLPAVFFDNTYKVAVNGSLWTLPVEFFCYLVLAALGVVFPRLSLAVAAAAAAGFAAFALWVLWLHPDMHYVVLGTSIPAAASLAPFFFVGAALRVARGRLFFRLDFAAYAAVLLFLIEATGCVPAILLGRWAVMPYVVITVGLEATPVLRRWGRFGDFSYGTYLFAFPIQQTTIHFSHDRITLPPLLCITLLATLAMSWWSWWLIEKPALGLKPASPRQVPVALPQPSGGLPELLPSRSGRRG